MFERLVPLVGQDNLEKLSKVKVLLVGVGGVGGTCLDAMVRSGIKNITIMDGDTFDVSNLNRQVLCTLDAIGCLKVDVAKEKMELINKDVNIKKLSFFLNEETIDYLEEYDYIIDACDDVKAKLLLMEYAEAKNIEIISSMGTGKRLKPSEVVITRLDKTEGDPLAKKVRTLARKKNLNLKIPVVTSKELPMTSGSTVSSSIFVPSTAGLHLAYYIFEKIVK